MKGRQVPPGGDARWDRARLSPQPTLAQGGSPFHAVRQRALQRRPPARSFSSLRWPPPASVEGALANGCANAPDVAPLHGVCRSRHQGRASLKRHHGGGRAMGSQAPFPASGPGLIEASPSGPCSHHWSGRSRHQGRASLKRDLPWPDRRPQPAAVPGPGRTELRSRRAG